MLIRDEWLNFLLFWNTQWAFITKSKGKSLSFQPVSAFKFQGYTMTCTTDSFQNIYHSSHTITIMSEALKHRKCNSEQATLHVNSVTMHIAAAGITWLMRGSILDSQATLCLLQTHLLYLEHKCNFNQYPRFLNGQKMLGGAGTVQGQCSPTDQLASSPLSATNSK
jgi:hypothetical protein